MSGLKQLRTRIKSVQSTQKITKAMKMVAAARLKRATNAALGAKPYFDSVNKILAQISLRSDNIEDPPLIMTGNGRDL